MEPILIYADPESSDEQAAFQLLPDVQTPTRFSAE